MTRSRKLFSLLYNDDVYLSPGKRVLSPSEYTDTLSAEELIKAMNEELARKKIEDAEETEAQRRASVDAGFNEGLQKWAVQLAEFEKSLQLIKAATEKNIIPVAIKAAEKIIGKKLVEEPEIFIDIVKQSLKAVAQHRRFTLYISPKELSLFEDSKSSLRQVIDQPDSFSIIPREGVPAGQCIIETESGIINVNLEELWKALETAFQQLVKS